MVAATASPARCAPDPRRAARRRGRRGRLAVEPRGVEHAGRARTPRCDDFRAAGARRGGAAAGDPARRRLQPTARAAPSAAASGRSTWLARPPGHGALWSSPRRRRLPPRSSTSARSTSRGSRLRVGPAGATRCRAARRSRSSASGATTGATLQPRRRCAFPPRLAVGRRPGPAATRPAACRSAYRSTRAARGRRGGRRTPPAGARRPVGHRHRRHPSRAAAPT